MLAGHAPHSLGSNIRRTADSSDKKRLLGGAAKHAFDAIAAVGMLECRLGDADDRRASTQSRIELSTQPRMIF